ncbi:MAG: threonine/serine exporter family protein [Eubacteriales bacterium]|nr:threonine/serine exporter family protein [Eubacteriales bacterium]
MVENIKLVLFSFTASAGFGIVFRIEKKNLLWAGVGGALTRCVYLFLLGTVDERFVYSLLAAMFAALYAEIMAMRRKMPSTVFLYPAIIPLIPGDLLYNTAVNLILGDTPEMISNAVSCAVTLAGMSLGFVIISTFTYYRRIYHFGKEIAYHLLRHPQKNKQTSQ